MDNLGKRIAALSPAKKALLERRLSGSGAAAEKRIIPRRIARERAALSFAQERLWFLDQLEPNRAVYNIPVGLRMKGSVDAGVLERCLKEIVQRHEAIRTR